MKQRKIEPGEELKGLPPRHYHEWDYNNQSYRPDWVSVYEGLHPRAMRQTSTSCWKNMPHWPSV